MISPPAARGELPRFYELDPLRFQELCRDLYQAEPEIATAEVFGVPGQLQRGVDIVATPRQGVGICVGHPHQRTRSSKRATCSYPRPSTSLTVAVATLQTAIDLPQLLSSSTRWCSHGQRLWSVAGSWWIGWSRACPTPTAAGSGSFKSSFARCSDGHVSDRFGEKSSRTVVASLC
jgi:hypothetical protein